MMPSWDCFLILQPSVLQVLREWRETPRLVAVCGCEAPAIGMESNLLSVRSWNAGVGGLEKFSRGAGQERRPNEEDLFFFFYDRGRENRIVCLTVSNNGNGMFYLFFYSRHAFLLSSLVLRYLLLDALLCLFSNMSHSTAECRAADGLTGGIALPSFFLAVFFTLVRKRGERENVPCEFCYVSDFASIDALASCLSSK